MIAEEQKALLKRVKTLEKELASREKIIAEKDKSIAEKERAIAQKEDQILRLENELLWLRKKVFGRMSEKRLSLDPSALDEPTLFGDEMSPEERARLNAEAAKELDVADKSIRVAEHERKARKPIDTSKLEVKEVHVYPEGLNMEDYSELAPEVSDKLVLVPSRMYVERTVRHK